MALVAGAEADCLSDATGAIAACGNSLSSGVTSDLAALCEPGECKTKVDAVLSSCQGATGLGDAVQPLVDLIVSSAADVCSGCLTKIFAVPGNCDDASCGGSDCKAKFCEVADACTGFTATSADIQKEIDDALGTCSCSEIDASFRAGMGALSGAVFTTALLWQ